MRPTLRVLIAIVGLPLVATTVGVQAENRRMQLTIEMRGTRSGTPEQPQCVIAEELNPGIKVDKWITVGGARPDPQKGLEITSAEIHCGSGGAPQQPAAPPYAQAAMTLYTFPYGERLMGVDMLVSGGILSGFGAAGEPRYSDFIVRRQVFIEDGFREGGSVIVPPLSLGAADLERLGLSEVLMKISAKPAGEAGAAFGTVSVTSDLIGADLLLDGGSVGKIPSNGEFIIRNVPVGEREVRVRDASGREMRTVLDVPRNRTVPTAFTSISGAAPDPYRLVSLGKNPEGYEQFRRERDAAIVVKIPAGEFLMGNKNTERSPLEHRVDVSEFLIDRTPVTWKQYIKFAEATATPLPPDDPYWGIHLDHPAVYVTWEEATAYCEWVGGRLPTEAEREKAARGTDDRKYPWGNEEPDPERAVFRHQWGLLATEPVGTHTKGASPYGLMDMGGNVWEWCSDWYDDKYYEVSPRKDPKGPETGRAKVVRGGSWDSRPAVTSASCRNWGYRGYREGDFGFRCAMTPRPPAGPPLAGSQNR